jgi:hypothetical protein
MPPILDPEWEHLPCKLETESKKLTHGNVQAKRFLYASILAAGAREMQVKAVERELRWTSDGMWSATNEHEGQPASQVGPNMKW